MTSHPKYLFPGSTETESYGLNEKFFEWSQKLWRSSHRVSHYSSAFCCHRANFELTSSKIMLVALLGFCRLHLLSLADSLFIVCLTVSIFVHLSNPSAGEAISHKAGMSYCILSVSVADCQFLKQAPNVWQAQRFIISLSLYFFASSPH